MPEISLLFLKLEFQWVDETLRLCWTSLICRIFSCINSHPSCCQYLNVIDECITDNLRKEELLYLNVTTWLPEECERHTIMNIDCENRECRRTESINHQSNLFAFTISLKTIYDIVGGWKSNQFHETVEHEVDTLRNQFIELTTSPIPSAASNCVSCMGSV